MKKYLILIPIAVLIVLGAIGSQKVEDPIKDMKYEYAEAVVEDHVSNSLKLIATSDDLHPSARNYEFFIGSDSAAYIVTPDERVDGIFTYLEKINGAVVYNIETKTGYTFKLVERKLLKESGVIYERLIIAVPPNKYFLYFELRPEDTDISIESLK